jgi:uncharacterized cysteine cluster protein YcgN (CxxCxxCC family)
MSVQNEKFWETTPLSQMTEAQWESLCDGCGRCCLIKLQDPDDASLVEFTSVACRKYDCTNGGCSVYQERHDHVPECINLTADNLKENIGWLPGSCAYRRLSEGKDLEWWHPLVSGNEQTVVDAGPGVRGRVVPETDVPDAELENHIVAWLNEDQA